MNKITFAGSNLSCVHLQSWRRQSGDRDSSPVSRVTLIGQTSPSQFIAGISFQSGFCVPENNRRLRSPPLAELYLPFWLLVSFCNDADVTPVIESSGADGTSQPETLKTQLKSFSRSGIKDNTGLTGGRAIRPQIRRVR